MEHGTWSSSRVSAVQNHACGHEQKTQPISQFLGHISFPLQIGALKWIEGEGECQLDRQAATRSKLARGGVWPKQ